MACLLFCASAAIASNNFNSAFPRLSCRDVTDPEHGRAFFTLLSSLLAKEQEFRFERPEAQTVELMAEFNQWKGQPMTKETNGTWTIKVSIPPGTYGYKFLVDGKDWAFDPKNSRHKTVAGLRILRLRCETTAMLDQSVLRPNTRSGRELHTSRFPLPSPSPWLRKSRALYDFRDRPSKPWRASNCPRRFGTTERLPVLISDF
jgi:hypothetical protein